MDFLRDCLQDCLQQPSRVFQDGSLFEGGCSAKEKFALFFACFEGSQGDGQIFPPKLNQCVLEVDGSTKELFPR